MEDLKMKKVIRGLYYDTDTAKKLAGYYPVPYDVTNFRHYSEELYKKRTGEYFLYGEGGPMSPYAEYAGPNEATDGEEIKPLTFDEAKEWYKKAMADDTQFAPEDTYKKEFETFVQVGPKTHMSINLSKGAKKKLQIMAQQQHKSLSDVVESLIMSE